MNTQKPNRREMIALMGGAALTGLTLGGCHSLSNRTPQPNGFRIGACDWTLGKRADPAALEVAAQIGLDGVQVSLGTLQNDMHLRRPEIQQTYRDMEKKTGARVASLAIGEMNNVPYKNDSRPDQWVADSIDACRALGVKVVLLAFFGKGDLRDDQPGTDVVVKKLRQVAPHAEKAGVYLGFESWLSAEQHLDILQRVGSPALKVYYDVGNSHLRGYDIYREIRLLGKNICEFHAKDYDDLYGKGSIDFVRVRRAMDDIGFRGWIQMEGVKMPLGRLESCRYDLQYLKTIFPLVV